MDHLESHPIYLRAHTVPIFKAVPLKWPRKNKKDQPKWAKYVVCFDCETRVDLKQDLVFGVYRVCELRDATYTCIEDGLFFANDLPAKARKVLEDYVNHTPSDIALKERGPGTKLHLHSCEKFIEKVFYKYAHRGALIVGFNLPFDLSRLARQWIEGMKNEWSLQLMKNAPERTDNQLYPNILIEPLDSKKAFIRFASQGLPKGCTPSEIGQSRFFDLRTALWGLFNKSYSLKSACDNKKGPFKGCNLPQKIDHKPTGKVTLNEIEYARQDVRCTEALLNETKRAFDLHIDLSLTPENLYSQATMAKSYLEAQQIERPKKFSVPSKILGIAMNAYTGGRSETKIRLAEVPVVPVDLTSEYPSGCVLMKLWDILIAESLSFPDVTAEVQTLLQRLALKNGLDECFNRQLWPEFSFFAQIVPDKTILPVRHFYNGMTLNVGNNFLSSDKEMWVAGPDLVAHVIRTGNVPHILEAIRVVPQRKQKGMKPVKFRGQIEIDPYQHDMFKRVIELRKSSTTSKDDAYALKIFANAMYGFFAEVNPENVYPIRVKVFSGSLKPYVTDRKKDRIERPGPWYAPYLSSLITASGRLCLALIEECVTRAGGAYLYADTDALGIVASEHGGSLDHVPGCKEAGGVKALAFSEVDEITEKFEGLNPYDKDTCPSLRFLNLTDDNYKDKTKTRRRSLLGMSISAKRYVLYERNGDEITIINPKAHGLGHLHQPIDSPDGWHDEHEAPKWIFDTWKYLLHKVLGLKPITLPWLKYPLMMREAVTTCNLLKGLTHITDDDDFPFDGFRPFNFFMRPMLRKDGATPDCFESLVTSLETDARKWPTVRCYDTSLHSERSYRISTNIMDAAIPIPVVKDFETMLSEYLRHPETKSLGPNGEPCTGRTVGLLQRMHIIAGEIIDMGKESPRGIEAGDEPTEVMDFQTEIYSRTLPAKKNMVQPTADHVQQLRKIGRNNLIPHGCSERCLQKIRTRDFMSALALQSFERAVHEYKALKPSRIGGAKCLTKAKNANLWQNKPMDRQFKSM